MKKYKIVFIDIDDTLNPSNEPVSKHTQEVMQKLKDSGIITVINSGRSTGYAIKKSLEANMSQYVIGSNGAEVYDYHKRKIISIDYVFNNSNNRYTAFITYEEEE